MPSRPRVVGPFGKFTQLPLPAAVLVWQVVRIFGQMPRYTLKQYSRPNYPRNTVGRMAHEWSFEAADLNSEIGVALTDILTDFHPPADFAVMRDDAGQIVWEDVRA
jgi:hypothetical protein